MRKNLISVFLCLIVSLSLMCALPVFAKKNEITVLVKDPDGNPIADVAVYITQNPVGTDRPGIGGQSPAYITDAEGKVHIAIDLTDTTTFPSDPSSTTTFSPWDTNLPIVGVWVYDTVHSHYHMYPMDWKLNKACSRTIPITHDMTT